MDPGNRASPKGQYDSQRESGGLLGVMPAVDHDDLFFQDNGHLYAVSLETGAALPGWLATYPTTNGVYKLTHTSGSVDLTGQLLCVTVTDQNVVALMGLPDASNQFAALPQMQAMAPDQIMHNLGPARLVCLDRASGKELWNVSSTTHPKNSAIYATSSWVVRRWWWATTFTLPATAPRACGQFEDCYVVCFSMHDGSLRLGSYIASSASSPMILPNGMMAMRDATSHLAYAGGSVFVSTELGAIASLDAFSGSILWLDIYRDESVQQNFEQMRMGGSIPMPA